MNFGSGKYPTAFPRSSHCWCDICVRERSDCELLGLKTSTEDDETVWGKRVIRSDLIFLMKENQWTNGVEMNHQYRAFRLSYMT
jgi:hypothetical protein